MSQHTPGPWQIQGEEIHSAEYVLGAVYGIDDYSEEDTEADANARLIAAAPELLQACQELIRAYVEEYILREEVGLGDEEMEMAQARAARQARTAIAKARGQQP